jgi:MFS transporter, DHA1 family, multidrug resistance protein
MSVPASPIRKLVPLSIITCASMLAMDLYLPAVPSMQRALGIDVTLAQATIAVFLAGLAGSQLVWAEVLTRFGPRRAMYAGSSLLVLGGLGCATASNIDVLLAMRLVQGIGAGVATVVAPTLIRATLSAADSVRGFSIIAMIESLVPAAGPLLGAALLSYFDWRMLFWLLSAVALMVVPFVIRITPAELPGLDRTIDGSYRRILGNSKYRRLSISQALSVGTLLTFVASAPQVMISALGLETSAFVLLQALGVASFMITASQSSRISLKIGAAGTVQLGAGLQILWTAALLIGSLMTDLSFAAVATFWCGFCCAQAIRGPSAVSEALSVPTVQMGRASAMLLLAIMLAAAIGTQLVAPYLGSDRSLVPLATALLLGCLLSFAFLIPYPQASLESNEAVSAP